LSRHCQRRNNLRLQQQQQQQQQQHHHLGRPRASAATGDCGVQRAIGRCSSIDNSERPGRLSSGCALHPPPAFVTTIITTNKSIRSQPWQWLWCLNRRSRSVPSVLGPPIPSPRSCCVTPSSGCSPAIIALQQQKQRHHGLHTPPPVSSVSPIHIAILPGSGPPVRKSPDQATCRHGRDLGSGQCYSLDPLASLHPRSPRPPRSFVCRGPLQQEQCVCLVRRRALDSQWARKEKLELSMGTRTGLIVSPLSLHSTRINS
jgi:hypothetical protein